MPTYDYECQGCGHTFEYFQGIKAEPLKKCPKCGKNKVKRMVGAGAGILFRGSGFYETDYRSRSYVTGSKADKSSAGTSAAKDKPAAKDKAS